MDLRFETDRLILRRWRVSEAAIQRELWLERGDNVPPHRRIDADGNPSIHDLAERIRGEVHSPVLGLLALERKQEGDVRVWATVRVWNHASLGVLTKLGFVDTGRLEPDEVYGDTVYLAKRL